MILYVESNFILEVALAQEEAVHAADLLKLGEAGQIEIRIPSFALCEPLTTAARRRTERDMLARSIRDQLQQLRRSPIHTSDHRRLRHVPSILTEIGATQSDELERVISTILRVGNRVELDGRIFDAALQYRRQYGFGTLQDAIMYASVVADIGVRHDARPRCFVTRNRADFEANPRVRAELRGLGCEIKSKFEAASGYVRSRLAGPP